MNDSKTPHTDAEASDGWSGDAICVSADFARQLERELQQILKERDNQYEENVSRIAAQAKAENALDALVFKITGNEGEDDSETVLLEYISSLKSQLSELKFEIDACLKLEPLAVRVCEGGAEENIAASLAVTMASVHSQLSQWQEVGKECLETNGGPIDGADTLDGNDYAMVKMETFLKLQKLYTNLIGQNKEPK